jgi:murein DD-endopeptidase MepM/ murein hydrolase activator NlpD
MVEDRARGALWRWCIAVAAALALHGALAADVYKYRDANGDLVYAEQKPDSATAVQTVPVDLESKVPRIRVERVNEADQLDLRAINDCRCVVEFELRVLEAQGLTVHADTVYHEVLQPESQRSLVQASAAGAGPTQIRYRWKAVLGAPGAQHLPHEPYRAPFAVGASYRISQAYPGHSTHDTPDSAYAVDLALPDGTPVYAAREGIAINLRHDAFRGAPSPLLLDQANMIEILHDGGTIAVYAHLHWDSVRVQPGQLVRRGEYIADSGNTGFTTGPHLHFAVIRNAGLSAVSVPLQFSGPGGSPVTPQQDTMLTAY